MYTALTVFIILIGALLSLVVLVQNSKGGGLAAGFSTSNQVMGVRRTTDLLEKLTWGLAIALMVFSVAATMLMPKGAEQAAASEVQEQIDQAATPSAGLTPPPPTGGEAAPAGSQQTPAQ